MIKKGCAVVVIITSVGEISVDIYRTRIRIYREYFIFIQVYSISGLRLGHYWFYIVHRSISKSNGNLSFRFSFPVIFQVVEKNLKTLSCLLLKGK